MAPRVLLSQVDDTVLLAVSLVEVCRPFTLAEVAAATGNFDASCRLDEGAYGCVYRGSLPGHGDVAIKRIKPSQEPDDGKFSAQDQFRREVQVLGTWQRDSGRGGAHGAWLGGEWG